MGVFYVLGNASAVCNRMFTIYQPSGALSGVTAATCLVWLVLWAVLHGRWRLRNVEVRRVSLLSALLVVAGLLLTFPPVAKIF